MNTTDLIDEEARNKIKQCALIDIKNPKARKCIASIKSYINLLEAAEALDASNAIRVIPDFTAEVRTTVKDVVHEDEILEVKPKKKRVNKKLNKNVTDKGE